MKQLLGAPIRQKIKNELSEYIESRINEGGLRPRLAIIQVGENDRSAVYINQKQKFAESIGAIATLFQYPEDITLDMLIEALKSHVDNPDIHGIIIQMPLPVQFTKSDVDQLLSMLPPHKDADGLSVQNAGMFLQGIESAVIPATTRGILNMCEYYGIEIEGKNVLVIGRSNLVGKPTALCMLSKGATVTVCHSKTKDLNKYVLNADIIVTAVGIKGLINKDMVKEGQVLIDVGISVLPEGGICGDIESTGMEEVLGENGALSPVPGGVGPLTVSGLFQNLVDLYKSAVK